MLQDDSVVSDIIMCVASVHQLHHGCSDMYTETLMYTGIKSSLPDNVSDSLSLHVLSCFPWFAVSVNPALALILVVGFFGCVRFGRYIGITLSLSDNVILILRTSVYNSICLQSSSWVSKPDLFLYTLSFMLPWMLSNMHRCDWSLHRLT